MGASLPFYCVRKQEGGRLLQSRKLGITRYKICWHLDLRKLHSWQNKLPWFVSHPSYDIWPSSWNRLRQCLSPRAWVPGCGGCRSQHTTHKLNTESVLGRVQHLHPPDEVGQAPAWHRNCWPSWAWTHSHPAWRNTPESHQLWGKKGNGDFPKFHKPHSAGFGEFIQKQHHCINLATETSC